MSCVVRAGAARAGQDRHPAGGVQHVGRGGQRRLHPAGSPAPPAGSAPAHRRRRTSARKISPGTTTTATPPRASAARIAISRIRGSCSGVLTSSQYTLHSRNSSCGWVSWKYSPPISSRRDLRGDRQHRDPAAVGVEQAVDQVQVARPAAGRAHRQLPGQRRLRGRRERRGLLVPDVLPGDRAVPAQRVGEPVQGVPRDPVHPPHTGRPQRRHHHVSHRGRHFLLLCRWGETP